MEPQDVPQGPLLVDTDVFSFWYRRRERHAEFASLSQGHPLAMSFACVAEALYPTYVTKGIAPGTREKIERALRRFVVLPFNNEVVHWWAQIHARVRGQLSGDGANDIWTAACALAYDLPLMTNNLTDYQTIQKQFAQLQLVHPDL